MRRFLACLIAIASSACVFATEFSSRFEAMRRQATPAQLYTLLYDLPKGGDLHNHAGGSERPEWMYAILTDPARNGGDTFYTRVRTATEPEALGPGVLFRTIRQRTYDRLPAAIRADYAPLTGLPPPSAPRGSTACVSTPPARAATSSSTASGCAAVTLART